MGQQVYILEDKNSGLLKVGISVDAIEFRRAFAQAGGLVCDHVEGQIPGQIDPSLLAVYLYAQSDVYIFPVTALTPTTREEALCAATG